MTIKPSKLMLPLIAAFLITALPPAAAANPAEHCDTKHASPEKMHEHMKARLDKLAGRLEIKASQQAAWEEFSKSVEAMAERQANKPSDDADAAAIARYRADRAAGFAKKMAAIADATAKLQAVLTDSQRKILNQESRRFLHHGHKWGHMDHEHEGKGMDHRWKSDKEGHHDAH